MAIVLNSNHGNEGKLCDVDEFIGAAENERGQISLNVWNISFNGQTHDPVSGDKWGCPDRFLLPIRPGDLQETDETERELTV
jgi:hypothetical protein